MIANWVSILIGAIGLVFAAYEYRQRTKMESVVRDALRRLAGEMRVIYSNASWTNQHLRTVGHLFTQANPTLDTIRRETFDAARDAAACARQLSLAHLQIRGIQQSLFKDSIETLPEIPSDDVRAAVLMLRGNEKKPEIKAEPRALHSAS